ncbi:MAG: hypothetical protein R2710_17070 [Acidimicrobiales bacterium]
MRIDPSDDVRHAYELSGGALMDLGCYPAQWLRFVVGAEPRVVSATMVEGRPNTDIITDIELLWDATDDRGSITGAIHTAMDDTATAGAELEVIGSKGRLHINNPIAPHNGHLLTVDVEETNTPRSSTGSPPTTISCTPTVTRSAMVHRSRRAARTPSRTWN